MGVVLALVVAGGFVVVVPEGTERRRAAIAVVEVIYDSLKAAGVI